MTMSGERDVKNISEDLLNVDLSAQDTLHSAETFNFEAEVPQIMSLIINSVYSSKEMFLRELISNASDAISKVKTRKNELESSGYTTCPMAGYRIQVIPDKVNGTLTIKDNGIGMTKTELISFLGSIASSGTKKFKELLSSQNQRSDLENLIGQFGLGFYSAFLVAERVDVVTKSPMDDCYVWTSTGGASYSIAKKDGVEEHGTTVILTLKAGEKEFLESSRLIGLIKKHSMYIKYPIAVFVEVEEERKEEGKEEGDVEEVKEETEEAQIEEEDKKKKVKIVVQEQVVNTAVSIWSRKLEEIPEDELKAFYQSLSKDYDTYSAVQTWHFEGMVDLKIILFIPKKCLFNMFETKAEKSKGISVFNSNVFVTDELPKEIVPDWMSMVVGAVSSCDFPMNISREFLQGKAVMNLLKSKLPKCIAEMIKKLEGDSEKYKTFYNEFSANIKMAVRMTSDSLQETYAKFLRYATNQDKGTEISLDEYLEKIGENQKQILVITGLTKKEVETSLCLEAFKDRLVLLMPEGADEIMLQGLRKYKDLDLQNVSVEGVDSVVPVSEEVKKDYEPFVEKVKGLMNDKIERVELSNRFATVPACILAMKYGHSSTMENMIKAQVGFEKNPMMAFMLKGKKIFELNIESPVIKQLKTMFDAGENEKFEKYVRFLYNAALVGSGYSLDDKAAFIGDLYSILMDTVANK